MTLLARNRQLLALVTLGAIIACAVVLMHSTARSDTPTTPAAVLEQFSVFSRPTAAADALPPAVGITATASRRISTATESLNEWIATKADQLCLVANGAALGEPELSTASFACGPPDADYSSELLVMDASAHPISRGVHPTGPEILVGLAPDGASSVTITYTDHSAETVSAIDNGWQATPAGRKPAELSWTTGATSHVEDMTKA